jgi:hypothetical protein
MPFCPNPDCPHKKRLGVHAEFNKGVTICSDCGSTLSEIAPFPQPIQTRKKITLNDFWKKLLLAVLIPIISTWLNMQIMYWSGNSGNSLWLWTQFAASVTIGVVCIVKISSLSKNKRALLVLVYLPAIYVVVAAVGLLTACFNGDCL